MRIDTEEDRQMLLHIIDSVPVSGTFANVKRTTDMMMGLRVRILAAAIGPDNADVSNDAPQPVKPDPAAKE